MSFHKVEIHGNEQSDARFTIEKNDEGEAFIGLHIDYEDASGVVEHPDLVRIRDGINQYLIEQGVETEKVAAPISNEPEIELKFE